MDGSGGSAGHVAPEWLSPAQRAEWERVRAPLGELSTRKAQILEAYAVERARWLEAEAYLQEHGAVLILRTEKGEVKQAVEAPQLKISARAQDRMLKLGSALGLSRQQP